MDEIRIGIAYVKEKGFISLSKSLNLTSPQAFQSADLRIRIIVGLSESHYITDYEPLRELLQFKKELGDKSSRLKIKCFSDARFHLKMTIMSDSEKTALIVGSSNITQGGLKNNKEANLLLTASNDYPAIQNSIVYFDWLWEQADNLTDEILTIYSEDKDQYTKDKPKRKKGRLPTKQFSNDSAPKTKELTIWIEDIEYSLNQIANHCSYCGRLVKIPKKWLEYFVCENHCGRKNILSRKKGARIDVNISGHGVDNVSGIEGVCQRKTRDGTVCGTHFTLDSDFTHQICSICYDKKKKAKEPCYKIPFRAEYNDSFFYDVSREKIFAKNKQ